MIPYSETVLITHTGVAGAAYVAGTPVLSLLRPLWLTHLYVTSYAIIPAVPPQIFLSINDGMLAGKPLEGYTRLSPFMATWRQPAQNYFTSGRDEYLGVMIPQTNRLEVCQVLLGGLNTIRTTVTVTGYLMTEQMLNSGELDTWET